LTSSNARFDRPRSTRPDDEELAAAQAGLIAGA
jgi:hypothetical protein